MKKVLITYATAGIGHKKAASAVKEALDEMAPGDTEVSLIDALDYTPGFFKWSYLKLYLLAVNKLSLVWGFMYYLTDNYYVNKVVSVIRRLNNWLNSKRLVEHLIKLDPDVIVSTHFFASEVAADLKRKGLLRAHIITVVTDYRLHSWWVSNFIDTYVVGGDDARDDLIRWNIPVNKIKTLGIPVEPSFSRALDKVLMQDKFGLKRGIFTILIIGGGFGVGPIEDIVKIIGRVTSRPLQAIVVCGHNKELVKRIEGLKSNLPVPIMVLGFVDNVYEFMAASDIMISKSGGITASESLAKDLPMVVIAPIPGQETHNCDFLISHDSGVKVGGLPELKGALEDLIAHPEKIERMRASIDKIKKPAACYDVGRLAVEIANTS